MDKIKTQVLVVGSGAAGITAAISSARNGAKTLLIKYNGFLGGISSTLPWLGFHDRDYRQVVKGLCHEYVTKLHRMGGSSGYIMDSKLPEGNDRKEKLTIDILTEKQYV